MNKFLLALFIALASVGVGRAQTLGGSQVYDSPPLAWTPVLTSASPGTLAITYSIQAGNYYKIGKMVVLTFNVQTSAYTTGTATGAILITGLPVAVNSTANILFSSGVAFGGWTRTGYTQMTPLITAGGTSITFNVSGTALPTGGEVITDFPSGGAIVLQGSIVYYTN